MRIINYQTIAEAVERLFISANHKLPSDAVSLIENAAQSESSAIGRSVMKSIRDNLDCAEQLNVPICQDTGMAIVFAEVGQAVEITGGLFDDAVNDGVRRAYDKGYMRKSVVSDPLFGRKNTGDNTPAVIYTKLVDGDKIRLTAAPKGFGSENMSAIRMFTPSATRGDIIAFVRETVERAGGNPCPPILVGVGIGGSFDSCAVMAKRALIRSVSRRNSNPDYAALEADMLEAVNSLGIGPQGFGGDVTALAVNIEYAPTHIAGLPVAVNINCHVMRHAEAVI